MKILKLILRTPRNLILFLGIAILFLIDFILYVLITPFAFVVDRIEGLIKIMLNLIQHNNGKNKRFIRKF